MPLRSIIVVFLRLLAIQWAVHAIAFELPLLFQHYTWISLYPLLSNSLIALASWVLAEPISRLVIRNHDVTVPLAGLTRQDLYAFAFVYLGLSFFVSGLGTTVITAVTLFAAKTSGAFPKELLPYLSLPQIGKSVIESLAGLIALLNANRFAKKLASREE